MKSFYKIVLAFAASAALVPGTATSRELTVVGFGGVLQESFRKAYFEPYAKARNVKLVQDSYDGGIAKQKAMVEAGNVIWDVVQMDENEMQAACDQGLLEKLDRRLLSNTVDVDPTTLAPCGVAAFVWSKVLTYDHRKFGDNGPKTWAEFFDTRKWPGKRGLRKQPRMTLEIALLADGVRPADVYKVLATKQGQDRAFAKLDQLKPQIQWWSSGAQPLEWLQSGAISVTAAYNGRIAAANAGGASFPIIWTNQLYSMDYWTIIKGSPMKSAAHDLVNFMLAPENQVTFARTIPYGIANKRALDSLDAKTLAALPTAPRNMQSGLLLDSKFWLDHEEDLVARFTKWVSQ